MKFQQSNMVSYKWCEVEGVQCAIWKAKRNDNVSTTEQKQNKPNKKEKEKFGSNNKDIPILDTRKTRTGSEYCNMIIYTDDANVWEQVIRQLYSQHKQTTVTLQGGHQIFIKDKDDSTLFLAISVYAQTNKIMIQPGEENEENILKVLQQYPALLSDKKKKKREMDHESLKEQDNEKITDDCTSTCHNCPNDTPAKGGTRNSADSKEEDPVQLSIRDGEMKQLIVNMPPVDEVDYLASSKRVDGEDYQPVSKTTAESPTSAATTEMPDSSENSTAEVKQVHNNNDSSADAVHDHSEISESNVSIDSVVEEEPTIDTVYLPNELLCYMQNKTQVCTQDFLVQVCCDFYCEEAISEAKTLLYKHVKTKGRLIGRRGAQKSVHEMRDIYQVLLEMEPTDKTTFVAHNLANLPPLSMDNTDTLRLLKEIENVKSDLRSMQIAQEDIIKIVSANITCTSNGVTASVQHNTNKETTRDIRMTKSTLRTKHNKDEEDDEPNKDDDAENGRDEAEGNKEVEGRTEEAREDIPSVQSQSNKICPMNNESFDIPSAQPQRDHSLYNFLHSDDGTNSHMDNNNESDTVSDSDCEITSTYFPHEHSNNEFQPCNDVIKTKTIFQPEYVEN